MARRQPAEEGLLFDLPLDRPPTAPAPAATAEAEEELEQPALPLDEGEPAPEVEQAADPRSTPAAGEDPARPEARPEAPPRPRGAETAAGATLRLRAAAGLTDLGACASVVVVLLVVLLAQGLRPATSDWPAGALFLLTFSFLYSVLPLAFWGRTPGMTLAGLRTTTGDGRPLSFRQAVLHWLGSVLTVALAGLPLLLALAGGSLSDRMSGSVTRRHDAGG